MSEWSMYVIRTRDGTLYTGISTDVDRRLAQHASGRGAKYLRGRGPLTLVYRLALGERSLAQRLEHALKTLGKAEKEALIVRAPSRRRLMRDLR